MRCRCRPTSSHYFHGMCPMPKAYIVSSYRQISDPQKVAAYAKLSRLALAPFGARYLALGTAAAAYEHGLKERIVIVEFPSLERAIAARKMRGLPRSLESTSARVRSHSRLGPEGQMGHLITNALARPFLHLLISTRRPWWEKPTPRYRAGVMCVIGLARSLHSISQGPCADATSDRNPFFAHCRGRIRTHGLGSRLVYVPQVKRKQSLPAMSAFSADSSTFCNTACSRRVQGQGSPGAPTGRAFALVCEKPAAQGHDRSGRSSEMIGKEVERVRAPARFRPA
jgi:uncharacterized protein (DUF1330 family)